LIINTETIPSELLSDIPASTVQSDSQVMQFSWGGPHEEVTLSEVQKRHILQTLIKYNGNISLSARALGIARNTLYRSIEVHNIDCAVFDQCSESEQGKSSQSAHKMNK
jgi:sigma-54 dependent transcriptional regulator, acetoin dehydrogenase operon transcriptional activator AcoR